MDQAVKRSNIRYLIDLSVKVEPNGRPPLQCKVRDYCLSGMFLTVLEGNAPQLETNLPITIEFQGLNNKRQRIGARIVHAISAGYGVKFETISDEALNALLEIAAKQQETSDRGPTLAGEWQSEGHSGLSLLLKDTLQRHVISLFSNFHESTVDAIFERSSRPRTVNEQNQMFEALDQLNKQRQSSFKKVSESILGGLDAIVAGKPLPSRLTPTKPTEKNNELSLVDDKEFEEWLWASSTVARLESLMEDELFALHQRLSQFFGRTIDSESNPFGAAAICQAFQQLISGYDIADSVRKMVIGTFQSIVEGHYIGLVHDLNRHLLSHGILPEVKRDMRIIRLGGEGNGPESFKPTEFTPEPSDQPAPPQTPPQIQSIPSARNTSSSAGAPGNRPMGGVGGGSYGGQGDISSSPASGLAQVRNLLRTSRQADGAAAGATPNAKRNEISHVSEGLSKTAHEGAHGGWYSRGDLTNALTHIESNVAAIRANRSKGESILTQLKASLAKMGGDPDRAIPVAQQESLEVIDNLMGSVQNDPVITEVSRPWFEELEVPLFKAAIKDDSLIENRDHPATHFLNRLDAIGQTLSTKGSEEGDAVRTEISSLITEVKEKSNTEGAAFDHALSRLEDLHDRMRRQYESNVDELTQRYNQEHTVETKRDELLELLDKHYGGQMLPIVIFEIMDAGWKNLLLRSYVREGAEGRIFRRFLEVIDQTIAHLTGNQQLAEGKLWPENTLLELIPRGLRQVPVSEEVISRLMSKLAPQFTMATIEPASIALKQMPKIMEIAAEKRRKAHQALIDKLQIPMERWNKAEDSVRSMHSGDMITLADEQGEKQSHKLVWIAEDHSRYVFVDGEGRLARELSRDDLTSLLLTEKAAVIEGWDVPLMDRATYSMLLSIHNKLLHQTNFDTLTGLLNRRTFELELEKLIERTRLDKTKNILCYLDLDHFSLVNSICGHDEGDRLLKETAELLRRNIPENALIGRLGGDEYALVLPDLGRTEGLLAARKLQQAFSEHRFACKSNTHRLTASFGITELSEESESATRLLAAVDTACRIAKESGRDRIEIYHDANESLVRREGLINLVGSMHHAMANNQLQLVCQRILPITAQNVEQAPYYEILLRVQDEYGQAISHAEFIQAAEMFNRSIEVDQWVTSTIIEWLEQRFANGKSLPVVSINLSARSVNSKIFLDAIAERIIRTTVPRNHICFEITETAAIGDMGQATHFINRLKRLGCSFSLDDFGTGLSSYSFLKALPVDYIKIDGSFVRNCLQDPHDLAVIKSLNEIGHAMGKKTIAEFVENEDILKRLHELGVDYAQGYGIEKPIPIAQLN